MKYAIDANGEEKQYKLESRSRGEIVILGEFDSIQEAQGYLRSHLGLPEDNPEEA